MCGCDVMEMISNVNNPSRITITIRSTPRYLDEYFELHQNTELNQFKHNCQALKDHTQHTEQQEQPDNDQEYKPHYQKEQRVRKTSPSAQRNPGKPYCGCGIQYSCTSALYLHIRTKHQGEAPEGTIGGPRFRGPQINAKLQHKTEATRRPKLQEVKIQQIQSIPKAGNPTYHVYKGMLPDSQDQNQGEVKQQVQSNTVKKVAVSQPMPITIGEHHLFYDGLMARDFSGSSFAPKQCKICDNKDYSCNSSLNLHLKRKHKAFRLEDGRLVFQALPNIDGDYTCQICGLTYEQKGILLLHKENKHSDNNNTIFPQRSSEASMLDQQMQKCGCGLVYRSRSALYLHVKKKHGGIYPEGTSNPPRMRGRTNGQHHYQFQPKIEQEQGNKPDIYYDSDSEQKNKSSLQFKTSDNKNGPPLLQQRIFKCGCGRKYTCSSALNHHIRRNHNSVVPEGTIGGPRGNREINNQNWLSKQQTSTSTATTKQGGIIFECGQCGHNVARISRFVCKSCNHHYMCSNCFWGKDNFSPQHEWVVDQPNRK